MPLIYRGEPGFEQAQRDAQATYDNAGNNNAGNNQVDNQPGLGNDIPEANLTYWERPENVRAANGVIETAQSQNPNWQPPEGLDVASVKEAYKYFAMRNPDLPVDQWKPLKSNDPGVSFLKSLPPPPTSLMPDAQAAAYEKQKTLAEQTAADKAQPLDEYNGWEKLRWDEQMVMGVSGAGYEANLADRPAWTRAPATLVQGFMGGLGPAALIGGLTEGAGFMPAMFLFGGIAAYQAFTGQRIPLISDIYDRFQIPAKGFESYVGQASIKMTPEERLKTYWENPGSMVGQIFGASESPAMAAGAYRYETAQKFELPFGKNIENTSEVLNYLFGTGTVNLQNWDAELPLGAKIENGNLILGSGNVINGLLYGIDTAYNAASDTAGLFGAGWEKVRLIQAGEGEIWDIHKGVPDPVKINGLAGDALLNQYYQQMLAAKPEEFDQTLLDIQKDAYDKLGYSGVINDLVGQTLFDPLNAVPFVEGLGAEKLAKLLKSPHLAEAAVRMRGNPLIDVLPFGVQSLTEALVRGKPGSADFKPFGMDIGPFGKRNASKGLLGTISVFKEEAKQGVSFGGTKPINYDNFSWLEKAIVGLTAEGKDKAFEPFVPTGNGFVDFFRRQTVLDPQSAAHNYATNADASLRIIANDSGNDIPGFIEKIDTIAGVNPETLGQIENTAKYAAATPEDQKAMLQEQSMLKSSNMKTVAEGIAVGVEETKKLQLKLQWDASEKNRNHLLEISKATSEFEKPLDPGHVLEAIGKDPDGLFKKLNETQAGQAALANMGAVSGADLKTHFDIYIGEGKEKIPWHPDEFKAIYMNKIIDGMGKYLVKRYDIKAPKEFFRLIGALKDVQSLLVLGLNPGYFLNNVINNIVTRAAQGVFGFMTTSQVDAALTRLEFKDLPRLREGIGAGGIGDVLPGIKAVQRAAMAKGTIENFRKTVRGISKRVGIFQNLSQRVEQHESLQAYTIGTLDMWNKLWKVDTGFDRLPAGIERALDAQYPGLKEKYYELARSGMNMDEIRAGLSKDLITPDVIGVLDQVVADITPIGKEMFELPQEMVQELKKDLENAKTPEDADVIINNYKNKLKDNIRAKQIDTLIGISKEVPELMKSEGKIVALKIFAKVQELVSHDYLAHFKEWHDLMDAYKNADFVVRRKAVKDLMLRQAEAFKDLHAQETAAYNGIIAGMGLSSKEAQSFVTLITKMQKLSEDFFDERNRLQIELYANAKPKDDEWKAAQARFVKETNVKYQEHNKARTQVMKELGSNFASMLYSSDPVLSKIARGWWLEVVKIEQKRQSAMESMRQQLADGNVSGKARNEAWAQFIDNVYTPVVWELTNKIIDGANGLKGQPEPVEPELPKTPPSAPVEEIKPASTPAEQKADLVNNAGEAAADVENMSDAEVAKKVDEYEPGKAGTPGTLKAILDVAEYNYMQIYDVINNQKVIRSNTHPEMQHFLNAVNAYSPEIVSGEKPRYTDIQQIPLDVVEKAMSYQAKFSQEEKALNKAKSIVNQYNDAVKAKLNAESMEEKAAADMRIAELTAKGLRARADIVRGFESWGIDPKKVAHYTVFMDLAADTWARKNGFVPNEMSRYAYYETHIGDIVAMGDPNKWGTKFSLPESGMISQDQIIQMIEMTAFKKNPYSAADIFGNPKRPEDIIETAIALHYLDENGKQSVKLIEELKANSKYDAVKKVLRQGRRGEITFNRDGQAWMRAVESPDFATMVHEPMHMFMRDLSEADLTHFLKRSGANLTVDEYLDIRYHWDTAPSPEAFNKWLADNNKSFTEMAKLEEFGAAALEKYFIDGIAPTPQLRAIFRRFKEWMLEVYSNLKQFYRVMNTDSNGNSIYNLDIRTEIDGIKISTIFDKMISDGALEPQHFESILKSEIAKPNKSPNLNVDERLFIAKRNTLKNLLSSFGSEEEASISIENMLGNMPAGEYYKTVIGDVAPETLYDALAYMNANPELNIWKNKDKTPMVHGTVIAKVFSSDKSITYQGHYAVVELRDLISDTNWMGMKPVINVEYPRQYQNRNRTQVASQMQMIMIGKNLNPDAILHDTGSLNDGPPKVGLDYVVDAGSGRVGALKYAAMYVPEKFAEYRTKLDVEAAKWGVEPAGYANMDEPTFIFVIDTPLTERQRTEMAYGSNDPVAAQRGPVEVAQSDISKITDDMLAGLSVDGTETLEAALRKNKNSMFVQRFVENTPANEVGPMMDKDGLTNGTGFSRIANAIVAKIYPGNEILDIVANGVKSKVNAAVVELLNALPITAKVEALIANGDMRADYSLTKDIAVALHRLEMMKNDGMDNGAINAWIVSRSMFGEDYTPLQKELVGIFNNLQKPIFIRAFLENYMQGALRQPSPKQTIIPLIPMPPVSKEELFNAAKRYSGIVDKAHVDAINNIVETQKSASVPLVDAVKEPWQMKRAEYNKTRKLTPWQQSNRDNVRHIADLHPELVERVRKAAKSNITAKEFAKQLQNEKILGKVGIEYDAVDPLANAKEFFRVVRADLGLDYNAEQNQAGMAFGKMPSEDDAHYTAVKQALSEGKPVPPEVIADYPDLAINTIAVKEPWQMKKGDYVRNAELQVSGQTASKNNKLATLLHKNYVRDALLEGKPVPPEVLADYPDLAANPIVNDGTTASVPVMITNAMKAQLRTKGVTDAEIRNMTPQQAWDRINKEEYAVMPEPKEKKQTTKPANTAQDLAVNVKIESTQKAINAGKVVSLENFDLVRRDIPERVLEPSGQVFQRVNTDKLETAVAIAESIDKNSRVSIITDGNESQNLIDRLGGNEKVAKIFSDRPENELRADIQAFNSGMKKVALVTDLNSLHYLEDSAIPHTRINTFLPTDEIALSKIIGTTYPEDQIWLYSGNEFATSQKIAKQLHEIGTVPRGINADSGVPITEKGLSTYGLQVEATNGALLDNTPIDGIAYYNGQPVAYVPNDLQVAQKHHSESGKEYQILGYNIENQNNLVVYLPNEDRIQIFDKDKPSLGQPAQKRRVTGFEDFVQSSFVEPPSPEAGLPLFMGKPIPMPEAKIKPNEIPLKQPGQSQLLDLVPEPEKYSPQLDFNRTIPNVNQAKIYFHNADNTYDLVIVPITDTAKIQNAIDTHRNAKNATYQVVSISGKLIYEGKNLADLVIGRAASKANSQGQGSLFDKPSLGEPGIGENLIGKTPVGKTPANLYESQVLNEHYLDRAQTTLDRFAEEFKNRYSVKMPGIDKLPPEINTEISNWLKRVNTQMTAAKLASARYGEVQRDSALLNYTWRYGADNYLNLAFPYQFWYTRTMMEWGKRMIDRPAWFSMYARIKAMQQKTEAKGIPSRFSGMISQNAPWLPTWAGSRLFSDPLQQLFPLELYTNLGKGMEYEVSNIDRAAETALFQEIGKTITQEQYNAAMMNKSDPLYVNAYEEARKNSEMYNPVGLASMMMQPGAWVTMPYRIGQGQPEKITILPITKTSRAFSTALKGSVLEPFGNFIEMLGAGPETAIRKNAGLSPYGQWGDYYIDRELANLVADGKYSATDAIIAMIDRKGDAYKEAEQRVRTQEMYKTPLATALNTIAQAVSNKGSASAIAPSLYSTVMPFGIFPIGEMKQRGLAVEYSKAWDMMKAGDLKAVNKFFADHPEYQARLAMNKEPDQRLKQLLISEIWDRYDKIPSSDKNIVAQGLGDVFRTNFLDNSTHDYETIDMPTLAYWAQSLGAAIPDKAGKVPMYQLPKLETYSPALSGAITDYKNEKNKQFPMIDGEQAAYFSAGANQKAVLDYFPQIQKYWDWKKNYETSHPKMKAYFDQNREEAKLSKTPQVEKVPYSVENMNSKMTPEEMKALDPMVVKMIIANVNLRQDLGDGAVASLRQSWEKLGKPNGTLQDWYRKVITPTFKY